MRFSKYFLLLLLYLQYLLIGCKEKEQKINEGIEQKITVSGIVYNAKYSPVVETDSGLYYIENWDWSDADYKKFGGKRIKVTGTLVIDSSGLKAIEEYEKQFDTLSINAIPLPPPQASPSALKILKDATWGAIP